MNAQTEQHALVTDAVLKPVPVTNGVRAINLRTAWVIERPAVTAVHLPGTVALGVPAPMRVTPVALTPLLLADIATISIATLQAQHGEVAVLPALAALGPPLQLLVHSEV